MKKHVRKIMIIGVTLLLPMLLILPITQAKRAKKTPSKPVLTQPNASQASLPTKFNSLVRPQNSLTPVSAKAVNFGVSPVMKDLPAPMQVEADKDDQDLKMVPNKIIRSGVSCGNRRVSGVSVRQGHRHSILRPCASYSWHDC